MGRINLQSSSPRSAQQKRPFRIGFGARVLPTLLFIFATSCLNWKFHDIHHHRDHSSATPLPLADHRKHNVEPSESTVPSDQRKLVVEVEPSEPTVTVSSQPNLPIYTKELASRAISTTTWQCGDRNALTNENQSPRPFLAFVHVYKTAGSTLRQFFTEYANLCKKALMLIVNCSGLKHSVLKESKSDERNWNNCRLKSVLDVRNKIMEHDQMKKSRIYPTINNTILRENFDILAGHYRFGSTDHVFQQYASNTTVTVTDDNSDPVHSPVRHIVFLRQPEERYVSSILYRAKQFSMNKKDTVEDTAAYIKKRIHGSREKGEYFDGIFNYLLTPEQMEMRTKMKMKSTEELMSYKTHLAIRNLVHYNAIVGMTEHFSESMMVLRHVLLPDRFTSDERKGWAVSMFDEYTANNSRDKKSLENDKDETSSATNTKHNPSQMGTISTSSVMLELKKDNDFVREFREYLKYEQIIVDYALKMHHLQRDLVTESKRQIQLTID